MWLKAATCRQLAVTLNELIEGSEYKFRVKAENPYGVSEPSEESDILFIPDPKRGINKPVKDQRMLVIDQGPPVAPKRRNPSPSPSPSPARSNVLESTAQTKRSPVPHAINTRIFDDVEDMAYGTPDDFYKFREVPVVSLQAKSEAQARQVRSVKFKIDEESVSEKKEAIYENLRNAFDENVTKASSESQTSGKRTYLDLSRVSGSEAPSSIQNSSEFMLVLYPESKESKNSTSKFYCRCTSSLIKIDFTLWLFARIALHSHIYLLFYYLLENDSFDLEMEEYFAPPPPLSQSAPELNVAFPDGPGMRHAVSSTELLYERAMARFYKAVEFEETENARKRSISVEQESRRPSFSAELDPKRFNIDLQEASLTRIKVNSLSETERSVLRRRLSGETPNLHIQIPRKLSFKDDDDTQLNTIRNELNTPDMIELSPQPFSTAEKETYSDYTDSTESSSDENENVPSRRSRQRTNDIDTYHPRMLSPYRQPENSEAAAVLTKPLPPLPDPNFVPKPILKRPASADGRKPNKSGRKTISELLGRRSASPSPARSPRSQRKSVEVDEIPRIIQPQEMEYSPKQPRTDSFLQDLPQIKVEEPRQVEQVRHSEPEPQFEPEVYFKPNDPVKKKLIERRQTSLEENHVMAEFYGDIIKDLSGRPPKPKVPIYMDPEALKKLEVEDEDVQIDSGLNSSTDLSPPSTLSRLPSIARPATPSILGRRSSEHMKPQSVAANEIIFGRRLSESAKVKLENLPKIQPIKDNQTLLLSKEKKAELTKSPSPQRNLLSNGSVLQKRDGAISSTSSIDDVQSRGRSKPRTGTVPKRRNQSQSRSRDSSAQPVSRNPTDSAILQRREKSSSRTRNRSESKSPSTLNRRIIINRFAPPKVPMKEATPPSSRAITPSELQEQVQLKVKSSMAYATDVSILFFATYVYFFKSAILALPIIALLLYRLISDKLPDWIKRKKS